MRKQKLYTSPNVDLDNEEPDPEFHSFILENNDLPIFQLEQQEAPTTEDEYFKNYKRPSEKTFNNLIKKQPKSVIDQNLYDLSSSKQVSLREMLIHSSFNHMYIRNLIYQRNKFKLKPRGSTKDTVSTLTSFIHHNDASQNSNVAKNSHELNQHTQQTLNESQERYNVDRQPNKCQLVNNIYISNKLALQSPYLQLPFRKTTLRPSAKKPANQNNISINQNESKPKIQLHNHNINLRQKIAPKSKSPQANQMNLYFQMGDSILKNNIIQPNQFQKKQLIQMQTKRNMMN